MRHYARKDAPYRTQDGPLGFSLTHASFRYGRYGLHFRLRSGGTRGLQGMAGLLRGILAPRPVVSLRVQPLWRTKSRPKYSHVRCSLERP